MIFMPALSFCWRPSYIVKYEAPFFCAAPIEASTRWRCSLLSCVLNAGVRIAQADKRTHTCTSLSRSLPSLPPPPLFSRGHFLRFIFSPSLAPILLPSPEKNAQLSVAARLILAPRPPPAVWPSTANGAMLGPSGPAARMR